MAIVWYDFDRLTNGSGFSDSDAKNTWAVPANGDVVRIKPGNRWVRTTQVGLTAGALTVEPWPSYYDTPSLPKPVIVHSAVATYAWNISGAGQNTIRDLVFQDCATNLNGAVVGTGLISGPNYGADLDVLGCEFYNTAYTAIRYHASGGNPSQASKKGRVLGCIFDDIGDDCIYGTAINQEVAYNRMTRMSMRDIGGDGVGGITTINDPLWIHHNFIDHRAQDYKHCIIVDADTPGTGYALIEDNVFIGYGYGSGGGYPERHNMVNGDSRMTVRRNEFYCAGLGMTLFGANSDAYGNVFYVDSFLPSAPVTASMEANGCAYYNNTMVAMRVMPGHFGLQVANATGCSVRNSAFRGIETAIRSTAIAWNPTVSNNAFEGVTLPYREGASSTFAGTNDVVAASGLIGLDGRPLRGSALLTSGADLGYLRDIEGKQARKYIGAYGKAPLRSVL